MAAITISESDLVANNGYENIYTNNDVKLIEQTQNISKLPPILIGRVHNINPHNLITLLNSIGENNFILKALGNEKVRVRPKLGKAYAMKMQFYTSNPKQPRSLKKICIAH